MPPALLPPFPAPAKTSDAARRRRRAPALILTGLLAACSGGYFGPDGDGSSSSDSGSGSTTTATTGTAVPLSIVAPTFQAWVDASGERYTTVQPVKLRAFGGKSGKTYTWSVSKGSALPFSTLSLDAATGVLSGTLPAGTALGRQVFQVTVDDGASTAATQVTLTINACKSTTATGAIDKSACHADDAFSIDPGSAADLNATLYPGTTLRYPPGVPLSYSFAATDGQPPYTRWRLLSGTLPPGTAIDASAGMLIGTPTSDGAGTTYAFTVQATDAKGVTPTAGAKYTIVIGR